jgi:hypothetical protein
MREMRRHAQRVRWELDDRLIGEPAPATALVVYRIVQEALGNVRKHAGASNVRLRVASSEGGVDVRIGTMGADRHLQPHMNLVTSGWSAWARVPRCQEAGSESAAFPGTGRSSSSGSRFRAWVSSRP